MKRNRGFFFLFVLLFFVSLSGLQAQDSSMTSTQFDMSGFPLWARDLRRGEIVAFGSFPFAYFFANFAHDTYRWSNNGWDTRYAPWPIAPAGAIGQTQSEKVMTLWAAAGGAVLIALVDYGIVRYKRSRLEKESGKLPEGSQVIVRRPLYSDEQADAFGESEFPKTE